MAGHPQLALQPGSPQNGSLKFLGNWCQTDGEFSGMIHHNFYDHPSNPATHPATLHREFRTMKIIPEQDLLPLSS